ncbi:hypothetical protein Tco_1570319 [Tanacetum coccineum]
MLFTMPSWKQIEKTVPVTEGSSETTTEGYMENNKNVSQDIRDQMNAEAKSVQIILTGIDNDIYSTLDACPNACKMWKEIERLKQGESINFKDLETNLYWEFGKFTSRDGESLESYYSRFYKMMNELVRNKCDVTNHQVNVQLLLQLQPEWKRFVTLVKQSQELKTVSYHKLYDILKQHQNEVNELRDERLARNANPPTMVAEDDEMSKEKEIDKPMALISLSFKKIYKPTNNNLKTSSNTTRECQKPKRAKDAAYHKEKMLLCKQEEAGIRLSVEQVDWRDDTDDEPDDQELEAHYLYMVQIQEVTPDAADNFGPIFDVEPLQKVQNDNDNYNVFANDREHPEQPESINDTYLEEQGDTNITIDSLDMSTSRETVDQDDNDLARERKLLASLIEKLKCEIDDSKNRNKFLETSNKALVDKLKGEIENFKTKNKSLESSNNHFKEANNELSKTNQLMFKDLKKFQPELDRYHDVNYASKVATDCAKAKGDLMSYKIESEKSFNEYTRKINDLNQTILEMKKELVAHQETISIMSQEKKAQKKFHKTREDKELEKGIALENKIKVLDNIFLNEIDRLSREYYYAYHMNAILGVYTTLDEFTDLQCDYVDQVVKCERLEKELSKSNITSKSFEALQQHAIDLELALQQYLKAQLQDKGISISELKKLIENMKGKSVETKFEKPSVIRQPNASQSQLVLGTKSRTTTILEPMTLRKSTISNTPSSSNSFVARRDNSIHHRLWVLKAHDRKSQASKVYYIKGLNYNLFSIGQFCDADLEVAFRKSSCYIPDLKGNDILTDYCSDNQYTVSIKEDMAYLCLHFTKDHEGNKINMTYRITGSRWTARDARGPICRRGGRFLEQAPPLPDFVPEPVYPEFMPPEDEVLPAEEQPLPAALSPTTNSLGYVPESDLKEDPKEDDDEDPEEDPGDKEEKEHPAHADSIVVALPAVDHAPSVEETKPFETDESAATPPPHPAYRVTARISIRDEPPTPFWSDIEVARLLAIPTPPPSPLSPWSSPLPQIPSPPLPVSPPPPASLTYPLGYRAAMIQLRAKAPSASHSPPPHIILSHTRADTRPSGTSPSGTPPLLPISLPTSSPPLHLPSADHGADRPEVCLPPRKRLCFAFGPRYEVGESSSAPTARPPGGAPATDDTELGRRMTEFATRVRQDTEEIYVRLDDEHTERQLMAGRLNMLYRDRRAHARTTLLMEREARMSREAWGRSMDASDLARTEVMSLRTTVLGQQAVISELQAADHKRQAAITELLAADRRRQAQFIEALKLLKGLQTQMIEFQRQQGPAKGPAQPDAPKVAGSSS